MILAHNYNQVLKDKEEALETYRQGIEKGPRAYGWISLTSQSSAAVILREQGKTDEALKVLGSVDTSASIGYWGAAMREAYAESYFKQGKQAEAIATMKEAMEVEGVAAWQKTRLEKRLAAMQEAK